jgi:hypothetical protein
MEMIPGQMTGTTAPYNWDWNTDRNLCMIEGVANTARLLIGDEEVGIDSIEAAAEAAAIMLLSDRYSEVGGTNVYAGTWATMASIAFSFGEARTTSENGATWEVPVPAGHAAAQAWVAVVAAGTPSEVAVVQLAVDDVIVYEGPGWRPTMNVVGGSVDMLPLGPVTTGQTIRLTKLGSPDAAVIIDGLYVAHDRNHVVMVGDPTYWVDTPLDPAWENGQKWFRLCNEAVQRVVARLGLLIPDGISYVGLDDADDPRWEPVSMTWVVDHVHPDDDGQTWMYEQLMFGMYRQVPVGTPRLALPIS